MMKWIFVDVLLLSVQICRNKFLFDFNFEFCCWMKNVSDVIRIILFEKFVMLEVDG